MITGKIILKSGTKVTLDQRFTEIAKQTPSTPRIQQQTNVTIPQSRRDLFTGNKSATMSMANRLKKRSIRYRLGLGNNNQGYNSQFTNPGPSRVFQRVNFGNPRRGGRGGVANSYLFGGQSGMGIRLRGDGRVGTRVFRSRTRGYLNNNVTNRFGGYPRRGNNNNNNYNNNKFNNRGRRYGNRSNRGRPNNGNNRSFRGRGYGRNQNRNNSNNNKNNNVNNNNKAAISKETLDIDIDQYMAHTSLDTDPVDMSTV